MNQLAARELINNGWFITSLCLVAIFAGFLIKEMHYDGWYAKLRNQAALALLIYFLGETIARGWVVFLLHSYASNLSDALQVEEHFPVAMIGAAVSFIGALCCVRIFSPASWGHRAWLGVLLAAAAFMTVTYVF